MGFLIIALKQPQQYNQMHHTLAQRALSKWEDEEWENRDQGFLKLSKCHMILLKEVKWHTLS